MKTYLINLDRSPDRLEASRQRFGELGLAFERFTAVDGKSISEQDYAEFTSTRPRNGLLWTKGKMGCFLSHYGVWQKIADSAENYAAVFEDDLHISADIKSFLLDDTWIPQGCDLVRLETSTNRVHLSKRLGQKNGRQIYKVDSTTWCAGGYILSKSAAQKLLEVPEKYHNAADHFMMSYEDSPVPATLLKVQVVPALCVQDKFAHAHSDRIRFPSMIMDDDNEYPSLAVRLRHAFRQSPLQPLIKTLKGYKRVEYADKIA